MKTLILTTLASLSLLGCASTEQYNQYTTAQKEISKAKSDADIERYKALGALANSGSDTAKVAAVMALALGNQGQSSQVQQVAPPQSNEAIQWASILVPGLTSIAGMRYNYLSTVTQSNNSAAVAQSTNNAFVGIAGKIQAPVANVSNVSNTDSHNITTSADQTMSGTGVLGSGSYGTYANPITTDNHSSTPVVTTPVIVTNP